jgi:hypothetical protein
MIIQHYASRQAPPRSESIPCGYRENQLTGSPSRQFPRFQGSAEFPVTMIEEPPRDVPPRPVLATSSKARAAHQGEGAWTVTLIDDEPVSLTIQQPEAATHDSPRKLLRPGRRRKGEQNGQSKLTWADVAEIREQARVGVSQRDLAETYQVSQTTIFDVISGRTWRDDNRYEMGE